jgi:hypothetical protein
VLPDNAESMVKLFEHLHLALFFVWRHYYELSKRLCGIKYKLFDQSARTQGLSYLKPGRLIIAQLMLSATVLVFKSLKALVNAYRLYKRKQIKRPKRQVSAENPQESNMIEELEH